MHSFLSGMYEKNELTFSLVWIGAYCLFNSVANLVSEAVGIANSMTLLVNLALSAVAFLWIKSTGTMEKYGLCSGRYPASRFLWYIPLAVFVSHNLWGGMTLQNSFPEITLYILNMLCVGFLEEVIFRGFLFKALCKENVKTAILISSITFGAGHILNLFNGSGMDLVENLCQVVGAVICGFLFVILFHRGGSLIPCIVAHGLNNAVSIFARQEQSTGTGILLLGICLVIVVAYTLILLKTLPEKEEKP